MNITKCINDKISKYHQNNISKKIELYKEESPAYFTPAEIYTLAIQANIIKPVPFKYRKDKYEWCKRNIMIAVDELGNIIIQQK